MYNNTYSTIFPVSGNPNGQLAGVAAGTALSGNPPTIAWDGSNFWVCTTSGAIAEAVWSRISDINIESTPNNLGTTSTDAVTIDRSTGVCQVVTIGADVTFTFQGFLPGYSKILLEIINGGAYTVTWPDTINWIIDTGSTSTSFSDTGIILQTNGTNFIEFFSTDGGTTIYALVLSNTLSTESGITIGTTGNSQTINIDSDSNLVVGSLVNTAVTTVVPATGASEIIPANCQLYVVNPAAELSTLTITLPSAPTTQVGSYVLRILFMEVVTTFTLDAGSGTSLGGVAIPASVAAGNVLLFEFIESLATWVHVTYI